MIKCEKRTDDGYDFDASGDAKTILAELAVILQLILLLFSRHGAESIALKIITAVISDFTEEQIKNLKEKKQND